MTSAEEDEFDVKESRLEQPSGWIKLTRYETVRLVVDALLEAPPEYRFNKSEIARRAGVSTEAIRDHLDTLVDLGVIEEMDGSEWPEYQLNDEGKVTQELFELNSAVNSVLAGEPKNVQDTESPSVILEDVDAEDGSTYNRIISSSAVEWTDNSNRETRHDTLVDRPPNRIPANAD
ncbi:winged helix-turn-helix domain-containing protein [Halorubrum trapanicum]|uniref:winged helix-turn-helix domain-containing protein n=1 Tax=Halorubrum trapanicum TaxID=29284 RepID=UPI003C6FF72F